MTSQSQPSAVGRVLTIWIHHDLVAKLSRLAAHHGLSRNAMVSKLVQEAEDQPSADR